MWRFQDAKEKLDEFFSKTLSEGPQVISCETGSTAVLVPIADWERLKDRERAALRERPTLKDLLLSDENRFDLKLPRRGYKLRPAIRFED
jgi:antitoxin Phd